MVFHKAGLRGKILSLTRRWNDLGEPKQEIGYPFFQISLFDAWVFPEVWIIPGHVLALFIIILRERASYSWSNYGRAVPALLTVNCVWWHCSGNAIEAEAFGVSPIAIFEHIRAMAFMKCKKIIRRKIKSEFSPADDYYPCRSAEYSIYIYILSYRGRI